jgi:protein phosphatase
MNRESHPDRHVVTRAIGVDDELEIDDVAVRLYSGDLLLLCSDGLTACVSSADLQSAAKAAETPYSLCKTLVALALERGAPDNVSVVAVRGMA